MNSKKLKDHKVTHGICRLTGNYGKFIKSHLIPKALTKPNLSGNPFLQFGLGRPPKKMMSSWYDSSLVTKEGEDILANYDDWAIRELNRLELIWTAHKPTTSLRDLAQTPAQLPSFGLRRVICSDPTKLRLFFLSLLWRAAATNREEFDDIQLSTEDLEQLRVMVNNDDPDPLNFYPTILLQIASMGYTHNLAPVAIDRSIDTGHEKPYRHNVFRFYFSGLIANMHRSMHTTEGLDAFIVGGKADLAIQMQLYEDSFQRANLIKGITENSALWPYKTDKICK